MDNFKDFLLHYSKCPICESNINTKIKLKFYDCKFRILNNDILSINYFLSDSRYLQFNINLNNNEYYIECYKNNFHYKNEFPINLYNDLRYEFFNNKIYIIKQCEMFCMKSISNKLTISCDFSFLKNKLLNNINNVYLYLNYFNASKIINNINSNISFLTTYKNISGSKGLTKANELIPIHNIDLLSKINENDLKLKIENCLLI